METLTRIPLGKIDPSPHNPRRLRENDPAIAELAASALLGRMPVISAGKAAQVKKALGAPDGKVRVAERTAQKTSKAATPKREPRLCATCGKPIVGMSPLAKTHAGKCLKLYTAQRQREMYQRAQGDPGAAVPPARIDKEQRLQMLKNLASKNQDA